MCFIGPRCQKYGLVTVYTWVNIIILIYVLLFFKIRIRKQLEKAMGSIEVIPLKQVRELMTLLPYGLAIATGKLPVFVSFWRESHNTSGEVILMCSLVMCGVSLRASEIIKPINTNQLYIKYEQITVDCQEGLFK